MAGFVIFSGFCGAAQSIGQLIGARVFQGMLAAVEMVLALAIIRDLYDETDQVRALAIYGMVIGGLASASVGVFHDGTTRPLAITILALLAIAGIAYWLSSGSRTRR